MSGTGLIACNQVNTLEAETKRPVLDSSRRIQDASIKKSAKFAKEIFSPHFGRPIATRTTNFSHAGWSRTRCTTQLGHILTGNSPVALRSYRCHVLVRQAPRRATRTTISARPRSALTARQSISTCRPVVSCYQSCYWCDVHYTWGDQCCSAFAAAALALQRASERGSRAGAVVRVVAPTHPAQACLSVSIRSCVPAPLI